MEIADPQEMLTPTPFRPYLSKAQMRFMKLGWYVLFAGGGILLITGISAAAEQPLRYAINFLTTVTAFLAISLLANGRIQMVLRLSVVAPYTLLLIAIVGHLSLNTPAVAAVPLCIILGGWLMGRRVALILAILATTILLFVALAGHFNLGIKMPAPDPILHWLTVGIYLAAAYLLGMSIDRSHAEQIAQLREFAFTDAVTGLPNRRLLMDRLEHAQLESARSRESCALVALDLHDFQLFVGTSSQSQGDTLLNQTAKVLQKIVRECDTVARLDADVFALLLTHLEKHSKAAALDVEHVTERIISELAAGLAVGNERKSCLSNLGVVIFKGHDVTADDLLSQAHLARLKARDQENARIRFFDQALEANVKRQMLLEREMRLALEKQQFTLHYQAQMIDEQLSGAEVLIRWQHPEKGMISPAEFIPLAESSGLIVPIGYWVLETACQQLALWAGDQKLCGLTLAVNVSARQFDQPDFVEQTLKILGRTGANPKHLKLELTESALVSNVESVIERMVDLKRAGISFSLDDFGTGYSSLLYLKRLPIDQLKIDQSFVRGVLDDTDDAAIACSIAGLATSLGLTVIAEGVETSEQRDFLAKAGCNEYQGYLFSKPVPLEGFEALVSRMRG